MARTKNHARKSTGGTKRKREDSQTPSDTNTTNNHPAKKLRPEQTEYDKTIPSQTPTDLSKTFTLAIKKHNPNLSTIELEDQSLPPSCFRDTTSFPSTRLVKNLLTFLDQNCPGGIETLRSCDEKATPHTLLLTSSAIRCTDLLRAVRDLGSEHSKIAKLFAKHMKLPVMEKYVRETKFGIAAGTPARILDLVKNGALRLDGLKRVVVDASYVDEKKRVLFDDKETFLRVVEFLNLEGVKERLVRGDAEVLVF